ncbi:MAG: hypothetical protein IKI04_02340 [Bacilli bacterium]|nr:hypothetical protein [Bacilli bacterium]
MNFIPNYPLPMDNNIIDINQIINKLNEYDNHIKNLEQRISKLESISKNSNNEPDNYFYMI